MLGSNFLSGAKGRLLPPSIPFRFFGVAMLFYGIFWGALFFGADEVTSYVMGSGPILSLIHFATLGVLTMTVIGASLQLLSVATRRAFSAFWLCRLLSWIYIPGFMVLTYGMYHGNHETMMVGAGVTTIGLLIFFALIIRNIKGVTGMAAIMAHCWAAMVSLIGLILIAFLLIIDSEHGFMEDHLSFTLSHFILAVFGFMSLLAMGFSYILVPMFALSPAPSEKMGRLSIGCNSFGILLILAGINSVNALQYTNLLLGAGVVFSLCGCGLYLYVMMRVYRSRMRKRLGIPFLLIRVGWGMLALTVVWGAIGAAGYWPAFLDTGHTLFAFWAIVGWLLTFLVGILQRILPFLSSMHTAGQGGIPLLGSSMGDDRLLTVNAVGHLGAIVIVTAGIALDREAIIQVGAVFGGVGAIGLFIYLLSVVRHMMENKPQTEA